MQWDDVRYFLALSRSGSLSASSRLLKVEHSTVARRIIALERALGVRLFDRLPRGWKLTPEGKALFDRACALEKEALALQRAAAGATSLAGTVRLSSPPLLISHFLLPHLERVRDRYPDITLELVGERREANLARGEADLALRLGRPLAPGLAVRTLCDLGYGLYGTAEEIGRSHESRLFVGFDDSIPDLPQKLWLDEHVSVRRYVLRSNDMLTMFNAAAAGWGVALLPHFLARADPRLRRLATAPTPLQRPLCLAMHPDVRRSPRVRAIADLVVDIVRNNAEIFSARAELDE